MAAFIKDIFRWWEMGPKPSGRIDHVFGTLTQSDLEQQFRNWHWKTRRSMDRWVMSVLLSGVLAFITGDIGLHGWTGGTMVSTAARGSSSGGGRRQGLPAAARKWAMPWDRSHW